MKAVTIPISRRPSRRGLLAKMGMSRRNEAAAYVARLEGENESVDAPQGWGEG